MTVTEKLPLYSYLLERPPFGGQYLCLVCIWHHGGVHIPETPELRKRKALRQVQVWLGPLPTMTRERQELSSFLRLCPRVCCLLHLEQGAVQKITLCALASECFSE